MEKENTVSVLVEKQDLIDNTKEIIYKGNAILTGHELTFGKENDQYVISRLSKNLVIFKHDGQMSYELEIKRQAKTENILHVEQFDIDVMCQCKNLYFDDQQWKIEYQLYQSDALLFDSLITISFLRS